MDNEQLIRMVCEEVLRRLQQTGAACEQAPKRPSHKVLAIFTGGTIGLEQGLAELKTILESGAEVTVVLSAAAERIAGEKIRQSLDPAVTFVTSQSTYPGNRLRESDLILIPVLTQNTAAKLACTFADSMVSTLILQALLLGKPVLAAINAANPRDAWREKAGMTTNAPTLLQALQSNLKTIETFGVQLVSVEHLADEVKKCVKREAGQLTVTRPDKRTVIDAGLVRAVAQQGRKSITLVPGSIVTPLARDVARECGVFLVRQTEQ